MTKKNNHMKPLWLTLSIVGICVLLLQLFYIEVQGRIKGITAVEASQALKKQTVTQRTAGAEIKGTLPKFDGLSNKNLEKEINQLIQDKYTTLLDGIYESTRTVDFSSQEKYSGDYLSIVLYFNESSTLSDQKTASLVIDLKNEKIMQVTDILGVNGVSLSNDFIHKTIAKSPKSYHANFAGIDNQADFYIADNHMILLFDKYEIAPGASGLVEFKLPINDVVEMTLSKNEYFQKEPYQVRMVRLNQFGNDFGYSYKWNGGKSEVTVLSDQEKIATMVIGTNKYYYFQGSKENPRIMEVAPEIIDGNTYVPIAFVREVLEVFYTVSGEQHITFSRWK